ncbi:hypothetical protein RchiOBHm_Chr5g0068631 [Rosa chinensis]|uniref:Uncharacterized protein n=1 Tax=Rosa chinensis TaxID=74649 RepID=A0A2P6QJR0_ROSCH|nr:hypothetical protein RchiOBHm_Chr5g0068631 [Rosa chinensis]
MMTYDKASKFGVPKWIYPIQCEKRGRQHIRSTILMQSEQSGQNLLLKHICK